MVVAKIVQREQVSRNKSCHAATNESASNFHLLNNGIPEKIDSISVLNSGIVSVVLVK